MVILVVISCLQMPGRPIHLGKLPLISLKTTFLVVISCNLPLKLPPQQENYISFQLKTTFLVVFSCLQMPGRPIQLWKVPLISAHNCIFSGKSLSSNAWPPHSTRKITTQFTQKCNFSGNFLSSNAWAPHSPREIYHSSQL